MIDEHKQNKPPPGGDNSGSFEYCNGRGDSLIEELGDPPAASSYGPSTRTNASASISRDRESQSRAIQHNLISGFFDHSKILEVRYSSKKLEVFQRGEDQGIVVSG
jgi:hypothetical protein